MPEKCRLAEEPLYPRRNCDVLERWRRGSATSPSPRRRGILMWGSLALAGLCLLVRGMPPKRGILAKRTARPAWMGLRHIPAARKKPAR